MDVLDHRLDDRAGVVDAPHDGRNGLEAGPLGRPPPPLPRHQLVSSIVTLTLTDRTDEDRLEDAHLTHRCRERCRVSRDRFFAAEPRPDDAVDAGVVIAALSS